MTLGVWPRIISFSGYATAGKDTAARVLISEYGYKRLALADPIKEALYTLNPVMASNTRLADFVNENGWTKAKQNSEVRQLLQRFGTEVGRNMFGTNFWVEMGFRKMNSIDKYVLTDTRFPNEIAAVLNAGGKPIRIIRPEIKPPNSHSSETSYTDENWPHEKIYNDSDEETFLDTVRKFMEYGYAGSRY